MNGRVLDPPPALRRQRLTALAVVADSDPLAPPAAPRARRLPWRAAVAVRTRLPAEPPRPRLDEFFPRRRADRLRLLRGILLGGPRLVEGAGRACADDRHARGRGR